MFITVVCECGRVFETPEAYAGESVACPDCRRMVAVPVPAMPSELFVIADEPSRTSGKAIASFALGLAFIFACLTGIPTIILGVLALGEIDRSGGRLRGRKLAIAGITFGVIGCLFTFGYFMCGGGTREAARRAQCVNNLKQIGLAMHSYHQVFNCLPPSAILDKNDRPLLSWRVALVPYLESSDLYSKFHLDEPWDSPHNLTLLDKMPVCYACPSDATLKPGMTGYQAVIGPSTAFTPDFKPVRFADITDGTSNTILIGESRHTVPWTKPEDLPFDMSVPLTGLGSHHAGGFDVLFTDGSVRFLKSSLSPQALGAMLTRNGNESVPHDY